MNPQLTRIDDADDPRLAAYRDIRERDLVGRQGLFIAEGRVVLNVLLAAGRFETLSVLLLDARVDGSRDLIAAVPPRVPIYVASRAVLDTLAGFPMHRGILAVGRRCVAPAPAELLSAMPPAALVLALVGIANHDNMGALFRNAAAFGADAVLLDETCCDPLYRKAIRVSVGAALKVPYAQGGAGHSIAHALAEREFDVIALSPSGALDIAECRPATRLALVVGTEGAGLPPDLLDRWQTARISMAPGFDSLNVATAAAIALHQVSRARRKT